MRKSARIWGIGEPSWHPVRVRVRLRVRIGDGIRVRVRVRVRPGAQSPMVGSCSRD